LKQREPFENVVVMPWVTYGSGCEFMSGSVIGHTGFGFERNEEGVPVEIVHTGGVCVGARVRIGSNTVVCRGTVDDTMIGDDVKIDALCHVAHNVKIGARTMVAAMAMIGGSVEIGQDAWLGAGCTIINKVKIARGAYIGLGAVVVKDVPEKAVMIGNPARVLRYLD